MPSPEPNALETRLVDHAVAVVRFMRHSASSHPAGMRAQLARCGMAAHALYAEARRAESLDDFIHKIALADKELAETASWLAVAARLEEPAVDRRLLVLRWETAELRRIIGASRRTAERRRASR